MLARSITAAIVAAFVSLSISAEADDITGYLANAKRGMPAVVDPPSQVLAPFDFISQTMAGHAKMDRETVLERDRICIDPRVTVWPGGNVECVGIYGTFRNALLAHATVGIQKYFAVAAGDQDAEAGFQKQASEAFFQLVAASAAINDRYARFRKPDHSPTSEPPSN